MGEIHPSMYENIKPFQYVQVDQTGRHTLADGYGFGLIKVCLQTKLMKIAPVKTRDISSTEYAINTLVTKVGPPKQIYSDKESSILHVAKHVKEQLQQNIYQ